ncbi:vacuolar calcium ion transporter [Colletotrichum paranaense]|uniref:Vacuolar calcium ion transporter n=1 Tax=Colletotrichum paranaense TaxID=1914294 RepID=A0ABQ9RW95_9PEZI|nr:vacuolar calcium ion transporter [Colletotrichum paranaense]KAK1516645.1 vacuolar calcium ion transporter [Colletotrichum paranaense]
MPLHAVYMYPRMPGGSRHLTFSEAAGSEASLISRDLLPLENRTLPQPVESPQVKEAIRKKMFSLWLNCLLIFVPIGVWAFWSDKAPLVIFITNALAVVPLSSLLTGATEMIASDAGDTVGALLNITMGNLVELILFIALKHNQIQVVQASILGSMLVNLLPILGTALCVCGVSQQEPALDTSGTQLLGCLLFVSVFVLLIPAAFSHTFQARDGANEAMLTMSRASSFVVLFIYIFYFIHELREQHISAIRHQDVADLEDGRAIVSPDPPSSSRTRRLEDSRLGIWNGTNEVRCATDTFVELDSIDDSSRSASSREDRESERGRKENKIEQRDSRESSCDSLESLSRQSICHSTADPTHLNRISQTTTGAHRWSFSDRLRIFQTSRSKVATLRDREKSSRRSLGQKAVSVITLIISSALMSMSTEFLVGTIDDITHQGHLSESFIGLIILPVIGNVAEYVTVVTMASKEKLDLAIAVAAGSAIQIALCAAPITILAGWIMHRDAAFDFSLFEAAALLGAAALSTRLLLSDGRSNLKMPGIKGTLMCACYALIGVGSFLLPDVET